MPVDHTGTTRPRCVILDDSDVEVIRRVGDGNRSEGIRRLVRLYLESQTEEEDHEH